jgi:hypothetical protein
MKVSSLFRTSQHYAPISRQSGRSSITAWVPLADFITDTVVTFFPSRWAIDPEDTSDIYQQIRSRLQVTSARQKAICSVSDLAIVIIDQCSRIFFDRAAKIPQQPQVLEMFARAIGAVVS